MDFQSIGGGITERRKRDKQKPSSSISVWESEKLKRVLILKEKTRIAQESPVSTTISSI